MAHEDPGTERRRERMSATGQAGHPRDRREDHR